MKINQKTKRLLLAGFLGGFLIFASAKWFFQPKLIRVNNFEISVTVADSEAERRQGLGGKSSICDLCGMLFVFPETGQHQFWMKGMEFPLDIIWLDSEKKVVFLLENIPSDYSKIMTPTKSARWVLELKGGKAKELGLQEGTVLGWK